MCCDHCRPTPEGAFTYTSTISTGLWPVATTRSTFRPSLNMISLGAGSELPGSRPVQPLRLLPLLAERWTRSTSPFTKGRSLSLHGTGSFLYRAGIDHLLEACLGKNQLVVCLESPYLGIYREDRTRLYPRIWEGGTLLPSELVRQALLDGIDMGKFSARFSGRSAAIREVSAQAGRCLVDGRNRSTNTASCLFFRFFRWKRKKPHHDRHDVRVQPLLLLQGHSLLFSTPGWKKATPWGPSIVHLRGIEAAHRLTPHLYESAEAVQDLSLLGLGRAGSMPLRSCSIFSGVVRRRARLWSDTFATKPAYRSSKRRSGGWQRRRSNGWTGSNTAASRGPPKSSERRRPRGTSRTVLRGRRGARPCSGHWGRDAKNHVFFASRGDWNSPPREPLAASERGAESAFSASCYSSDS